MLADNASGPSAAGGAVAWHVPGGTGRLRRADGTTVALPGTHPALGGQDVAWIADGAITIAAASTLTPIRTVPAPGADALALSGSHVAWRAGDALYAQAAGGTATEVYRGSGLGRPALDGSRIVFARATGRVSRIIAVDLLTGVRRTLRRARGALLLGPSPAAGRLLFVRATARRQRVLLGGRTLLSATPTARRDAGYEKGRHAHHQGYRRNRRPPTPSRPRPRVTVTLTDTAFDGADTYVTRLRHRGARTTTRILHVTP